MDNLAKLKDIKPIVEVTDSSLYLFLGVIFTFILVIGIILYFIYQKFKKPIYSFDLNNSKQTAYKLINLIKDKEGSEEYINKLHNYTYKKEVPPLDMELFKEIISKYKIKVS